MALEKIDIDTLDPAATIVVATGNAHKLTEIEAILGKVMPEVRFVALGQLGEFEDPEENGTTFLENAIIKAQAAVEETGLMAIADDSGLCVDALNGAPGIYSARYGGVDSDQARYRLLLENLRFDPREEKNDPTFAKELADMAELYVSDAFGTVHRAHASTAGVAAYLPAVSGLLVAKELQIMGGALENPKRPFVAVLGGAKVSDKIGVINNLLDKADTIIIGGGMAYTFSKAKGGEIGTSLCEEDKIELALGLLKKAADKGVKLLLPVDTVCADHFGADAAPVVYEAGKIPADMMGMDIGPKTVELFSEAVKDAGTVVWNGPMGVFEFDTFAVGTKAVAKAIAESKAVSIIGGGDSAAAVEKLGFADKMTHISTGGGASLEFLEGLELPGIACLQDK